MSKESIALELRCLVDEMRLANKAEIEPIRISKLRRKFELVLDRIDKDTGTSAEVRRALAEVVHVTSFHRLRWGTCRMLSDPDGYRADARKVGAKVRLFIEQVEEKARLQAMD